MAKKAAAKINRSAAIKAYRAENPKAKPSEVAAAVSKQLGIEIKAQYVSVVAMQAKKKTGKKSDKVKSLKSDRLGNGFASTLAAAAAFILECGGLKQAKEVLDSLAKFESVPS